MTEPLLEVEDLTIQYRTPVGMLTAASNVSFEIYEGEFFGLVGESGCGKSTVALSLLGGLDSNGQITSGDIWYKGTKISEYSEKELNQEIRFKEISWIPQGSMSSLDPLERISAQAVRIGKTHTDRNPQEIRDRLRELFNVVGLPEDRISNYPHQFSGGMQQRAIIALALLLDPSLIIADEPTTALDVIMQDQVFKYLDEIQTNTDTSLMLITHDISLVFESCDKMAIMHGGQIAETGTVEQLSDAPRHPYSILLQQAFPDIREIDKQLVGIEGSPPQFFGDVTQCTFADRCPLADTVCRQEEPTLETISGNHHVACFRKEESIKLREDQRAQQEMINQPEGDTYE